MHFGAQGLAARTTCTSEDNVENMQWPTRVPPPGVPFAPLRSNEGHASKLQQPNARHRRMLHVPLPCTNQKMDNHALPVTA